MNRLNGCSLLGCFWPLSLIFFSNFGFISFPQTYSSISVVLVHCVCYVVWQILSLWLCKFSMDFPKLQYRSSVSVFVEGVCTI